MPVSKPCGAYFSAHIDGRFPRNAAMDRAVADLERTAQRHGLFLHIEEEERLGEENDHVG